jgi:hypothetical protein
MIPKKQFVYDGSCSNKIMEIAGKYLADVAPSREMAGARVEGKIKGLSPGRAMLQANPQVAFGAGGLGFNQNESAYYS